MQLALMYVEKFVLEAFFTRNEISTWLGRNKGESLFHLVTTAAIAYSRMIFESNELLWEEQSQFSSAERKKYNPTWQRRVRLYFCYLNNSNHSRFLLSKHNMSEEDRARYIWTNKPKFKKHSRAFLSDGVTKAGKKFFKKKYTELAQHTKNNDTWTILADSWDEFVKTSGFSSFYERVQDEESDDESDDSLDLPMSVPGSSTFVKEGTRRF